MPGKTQHWRIQIGGVFYSFETGRFSAANRAASVLSASNIRDENAAAPAPYAPADPAPLVGATARLWWRSEYAWVPFWWGEVTEFTTRKEAGRAAANSVVAKGGWHYFDRMVYTQPAGSWAPGAASGAQAQTSSVVLGHSPDGAVISVRQQMANIQYFVMQNAPAGSAAPNLFEGDVPSAAFNLPLDELRDATVAQCFDRILRYFPHVVIANKPANVRALTFIEPGSLYAPDASAYMEGPRVLWLENSANDAKVDGVRVETERVGSANGRMVRNISVETAGKTSGFNRLFCTLQLAGREASRTVQRLDLRTAPIPGDINDAAFWRERLGAKYKEADALTITEAKRADEDGADVPDGDALFPRVALNATAPRILEAGVNFARVEKWTAKAAASWTDDDGDKIKVVEGEDVEIEIVTTSGTTREYTWSSAASATGADPAPPNLAANLLARHAQDGRRVRALLALPEDGGMMLSETDIAGYDMYGLPFVGDEYKGLLCQSADYDLAANTVQVEFGPPAHISPQDLASLMIGGRTRKHVSQSAIARRDGEVDADKTDMTMAAAKPSGTAGEGKRTTIAVKSTSAGAGAKITLEGDAITKAGAEVKPREVVFLVKDSTGKLQPKKAWALISEPENDGAAFETGGLPDGATIKGRVEYYTGGAGPQFRQYKYVWNAAQNVFVESTAADIITMLEACDCGSGAEE